MSQCVCVSSSQVQFFATTETVAHSSVHGVLSLHIYSPGSWLPPCISSASHSPSFPEQSSCTSHYMLVSLKLGHMSFKNIMIIIVSWPFVCSPGSISHLQADVSQRSLSLVLLPFTPWTFPFTDVMTVPSENGLFPRTQKL